MLIIGGILNMICSLVLLKHEIDKGIKFKDVIGVDRYCDWFKFGLGLTAVGLLQKVFGL